MDGEVKCVRDVGLLIAKRHVIDGCSPCPLPKFPLSQPILLDRRRKLRHASVQGHQRIGDDARIFKVVPTSR